jgi:hypothetical protein
MARRMLLLVIGISVLSWANAAQVSYFDGGSFINAAQSNQLSSADAVTVVLGSLLNAETFAHSTAGVSEQVCIPHRVHTTLMGSLKFAAADVRAVRRSRGSCPPVSSSGLPSCWRCKYLAQVCVSTLRCAV